MYQRSQHHISNAHKALSIARAAIGERNALLQQQYTQNPVRCLNCNSPIPFIAKNRSKRKYCSHSCSAQQSNKSRSLPTGVKKTVECVCCQSPVTVSSHVSSSKVRCNVCRTNVTRLKRVAYKHQLPLFQKTCKTCGRHFFTKWKAKTCSRECRIKASHPHNTLSKRTIKHFNIWQQKEVLLDSSWEKRVAEFLDTNDIEWIRPDPMKWIDSKGVSHLYYADFYLPLFDVFLDPKNPYVQRLDEEKISVVSKHINLVTGDVAKILDYIQSCAHKSQGVG